MKILKSTLELKNKLGIDFKDLTLLQTAITHSSYANERNTAFNERLEFLGDTVLELIISEYLFTNHIDETEGYLTKVRALIVCENSLFEIAKKWELGKYIYMSKGEELTGGRTRVSILADAVEAIIAAVYLDEGLLVTKEFVLKNFNSIIIKAVKNEIILDYKTKLQEILQKNGDVDISYSLINFEGPPHRREFFVKVLINSEAKGSGSGYSKKEAEQMAAREVLIKRGDISE
ncbi:ribonuclease III [Clostridium sulfidigenes]|uniref:ribonuclease III n=1 Tax=Clostridium sulfidigenes TaxID=318464 RepID=UPI003F8AA469